MNRSLTRRLLVTAAGISPVFSAHAQEAPKPTELQEIIVTAERRSANVQDLPLQVSVLDAAALAQTTQVQDLQALLPSVLMQQTGPFTQFNIRGVGALVTTAYNDTAVAFHVDDVYMARPTGTHGVFYDLERIEVLKGPQGTLYGRNATAGAVNVITKQPTMSNDFGIEASYGNYDQIILNGFTNLHFGNAALRIAGQLARRDGYFKDGYNDQDTKAVRAQLLVALTDDVSITIGADYAHEDGKNVGYVPVPYLGQTAWDAGPSSPAVQDFLRANLQGIYRILSTALKGPGSTSIERYGEFGGITNVNQGLRVKVDWDLGFANWTTIGSHRQVKTEGTTYLAGLAVSTDMRAKQTSLETRLASATGDDDNLTWLVGAYYFKESQRGPTTIDFVDTGSRFNPLFGFINFVDPAANETFAVFTQESLRILPELRLTAGLRYLRETKRSAGRFTNIPPFAPPFVGINDGKLKWDAVNYRIGLDYDLSPDSMIYAMVSNGWHAGGFNVGVSPGPGNPNPYPNTYQPETLTAYAVGSKNLFFDRRLQLNGEIFYWKYDKRQSPAFAPINTGAPATFYSPVTTNVGKSHLLGASLDLMWLATERTTLSANVEYMHEAENDEFVFPSLGLPPGCSVAGALPPPGVLADCSGSKMPLVPKWSATVGLNHRVPLANGGTLRLSLSSKIESRRVLGIEGLPAQTQDGYTRSNAELSYEGDTFSVSAFVRNIEDRKTISTASVSYVTGTVWAEIQPPRTYGMRVSFKY